MPAAEELGIMLTLYIYIHYSISVCCIATADKLKSHEDFVFQSSGLLGQSCDHIFVISPVLCLAFQPSHYPV